MEDVVRIDDTKQRWFMLYNWRAMQCLGEVCRMYQKGLLYTEAGMKNALQDVKDAIANINASAFEIGRSIGTEDRFRSIYREEEIGAIENMEDSQDTFWKLFNGFCYDLSQIDLDYPVERQVDVLIRDMVAIGSMFMTEQAMVDFLFGEEGQEV